MFRCLRRQVEYIERRHALLNAVPEEVFRCAHTLEELVLEANKIRELPKAFFRLTKLQKLELGDNEISRLPPDVANLMALVDLDISHNQLSDVPDNIKFCKCLQTVDFSSNPIGRLPDGFVQLRNLTHLYLNDAILSELPREFGQLAALTVLELRDNALRALPDSVANLQRLRSLDLGSNEFDALPLAICSMQALVELWFDCNELSCLPPDIGRLRCLQQLDVSENRLDALPAELANCTQLTDLAASQNNIEFLPEGVSRLTQLGILKLDQNRLIVLTPEIGGCRSLQELILTENLLSDLPPSIGNLRALQNFNVDRNRLQAMPASVGYCTALHIFSMRDNRISVLPTEMGMLRELTVLDVSGNRLEYLPVSLQSCPLKALWITENQSQPLIKLQKDTHAPTNREILTCYLLPQESFNEQIYQPGEQKVPDGAQPRRESSIYRASGTTDARQPGVRFDQASPQPTSAQQGQVQLPEDKALSDVDESEYGYGYGGSRDYALSRSGTPHPRDLKQRHRSKRRDVDGHMIQKDPSSAKKDNAPFVPQRDRSISFDNQIEPVYDARRSLLSASGVGQYAAPNQLGVARQDRSSSLPGNKIYGVNQNNYANVEVVRQPQAAATLTQSRPQVHAAPTASSQARFGIGPPPPTAPPPVPPAGQPQFSPTPTLAIKPSPASPAPLNAVKQSAQPPAPVVVNPPVVKVEAKVVVNGPPPPQLQVSIANKQLPAVPPGQENDEDDEDEEEEEDEDAAEDQVEGEEEEEEDEDEDEEDDVPRVQARRTNSPPLRKKEPKADDSDDENSSGAEELEYIEKHVGFSEDVRDNEDGESAETRLRRRDTPHHLKNKRIVSSLEDDAEQKVKEILAQTMSVKPPPNLIAPTTLKPTAPAPATAKPQLAVVAPVPTAALASSTTATSSRQPPAVTMEEQLRLQITRQQGVGLGISIAGGLGSTPYKPGDSGVFVSRVSAEGPAARAGLRVGDKILTVNSRSLVQVEHQVAVDSLRTAGNSIQLFLSRESFADYPYTNIPADFLLQTLKVDTVLVRDENGLGFSIAGGKGTYDRNLIDARFAFLDSIYISRIIEGGAAEKNGQLRVGDKIVSINGVDVSDAQHDHALALLASGNEEIRLAIVREWLLRRADEVGQVYENAPKTGNGSTQPRPQSELYANAPPGSKSAPDANAQPHDPNVYYTNAEMIPSSPTPALYPRETVIIRKTGGPLGLSICGGSDHSCHPFGRDGPGLFVSKILPNAAAAQTSLRIGDRILTVNGASLESATHQEAVMAIISAQDELVLTVQHDPQPDGLREIVIDRRSAQEKIGISIKGGIGERSVNPSDPTDEGVFITKIHDDGAVGRDGRLQVGTRILEVNGYSLLGASHPEAVRILRNAGDSVRLLVCDGIDARLLLSITGGADEPAPPPLPSPRDDGANAKPGDTKQVDADKRPQTRKDKIRTLEDDAAKAQPVLAMHAGPNAVTSTTKRNGA